ncbi:hypothetical protein EB077_13325, partial [bacterium]|nr:hypothetical protein [bacterium]
SGQKKIRGQKQNVWFGVQPRSCAPCLVSETSALVQFDNWLDVMKKHGGTIPEEVVHNLTHFYDLDPQSKYYQFLSKSQIDVLQQQGKRRKLA